MKQVLQYLWIERYKCIERQGFNFTRKANIQFDYDTGKLFLEKNDDYCENFFGKNIELSCIVGQNGVGKTTLLRLIKEIFSLDYGTPEYNYIAIFYDGSKYKGWYKLDNCEIKYDNKQLELYQIKGKNFLDGVDVEEYKKVDYLYYAEQLVQSQYGLPFGDDELSTSHLLFDIGFPYGEEEGDHVNRFFLKEFEHQMNLIIDYGEKMEGFKIKYPPFVKATFIIDQRILKEFANNFKALRLTKEVNDIYHRMFPVIHLVNNNYDRFKDKMAEAIFLNIIYTLNHTSTGLTEDQFMAFVDIMDHCCSLCNGWKSLRLFLNEIYFNQCDIHIAYLNEYVLFMDYIDNNLKPSNHTSTLSRCFLDGTFTIPTIKNNDSVQVDFINDIKNFFKNYSVTAQFHSYIIFSWGLSSGEISLLNIFSRLYNSECRKESKNKFAVLLLDEIDVTLHPEWQRTIINELLKFIKFAFKGRFVQVIMTTHSPIMLSDIPKQNVVFLKGESGIEVVDGCDTFASNIFQLFREGFFIGDTGIGVYAEEKLKEIVDHIHSNDIEDKEIKKLIAAVGDAFLRNKLNEEYLIYHSQNNDIEKSQTEKIVELEANQRELLKQKFDKEKIIKEYLKKLESATEISKEKIEESDNNTEKMSLDDVRKMLEELIK